jgi:uncharacterized protein (TIGR04442 family)
MPDITPQRPQTKEGSPLGPDYLGEAREVLCGLLLDDRSGIRKSDVLKLINAKHMAYRESDTGFEGIVLDAGRLCDERAREKKDTGIHEKFALVSSYLDRYDRVQASLGRIVFSDMDELTADSMRGLFGDKQVFDGLYEGLFYRLFVRSHLDNKHLTSHGRKKLRVLAFGLERLTLKKASIEDVVGQFRNVASEEG